MELFAQNLSQITRIRENNGIRINNHLGSKPSFNHLARLAK